MGKELQIVMQQVEAGTTSLVSSRVWQQKLTDTMLLLQSAGTNKSLLFSSTIIICDSKRFSTVFVLNYSLGAQWQLQDLQGCLAPCWRDLY
jgi:hypothetical protein